MGLVAARLGAAWWATAKAYGGNLPLSPAQEAAGLQFWTNMAQDLITELSNAQVEPGTFVAPSGGGPVTGVGGPVE